MNWTGWQAFVAMGGYGLYVWGSVLVVLGALVGELAALALRRSAVWRALKDEQ
ncbi:MAG TPA: heme exporter protein CcmD [Burkholderiaceae bacterium]|nr:heme exporter protein CcmD [Burkholderiaceae bacterium]